MTAQADARRPANPRASLRTVAALLGVAPAALLAALERAGVNRRRDGRASESDVARVLGDNAARTIFARIERQSEAPIGSTSEMGRSGREV